MNYKMHPQPSSLVKATMAAKMYGFYNKTILDCFCGCGTHLLSALWSNAKYVIGTDIEDYSDCLRPELKSMLGNRCLVEDTPIILNWNIPAEISINQNYDILFVDPPNPHQIIGASLLSTVRDTHMTGSQRGDFWNDKFNTDNWINKKNECVEKVIDLFSVVLKEHVIIANCFTIKSNKFSYKNELEKSLI